jgi:hypothetical protein
MTELKKWLKSENLFNQSKEVPVPSHLLYDGGKIYVPRTREHEFVYHYSEELKRKSELYYVETRPRTFKFMIDIDITDDHYWTNDEIIKITKFIQTVVYDFYSRNLMTIGCTASIKHKKDGVHTGVHLIWPKLFVIAETALIIRRGIVQKLNEEFVGPKGKSWDGIIDELIYTRNGLRMVGSDKLSPKRVENPKTRESMTVKIPEKRPYEIAFVMNSTGELKENYLTRLQNDPQALIQETSIRFVISAYLSKASKGMEIKQFPKWLEGDLLEIANNSTKGSKTSKGTIISEKEHFIIEHFIRNNLPKEYSSGIVKSVTRYNDGNLLIKTDSRYCMNLGRRHNSCGIYFFASPDGLYQKCLCPCDNLKGRKRGYCRDYTSGIYPFKEEIRDLLFPNFNKNLFIEQKKETKKNKYIPRSETMKSRKSEKKDLCDKLLNDLLL